MNTKLRIAAAQRHRSGRLYFDGTVGL